MACKQNCWDEYNAKRRAITAEYEAAVSQANQSYRTRARNARGRSSEAPKNRQANTQGVNADLETDLQLIREEEDVALQAINIRQRAERATYNETVNSLAAAYRRGELTEEQFEAQSMDALTTLEMQAEAADVEKEEVEDASRAKQAEEQTNARTAKADLAVVEQIEIDANSDDMTDAQADQQIAIDTATESRDQQRIAAREEWQACRAACPDD
ncbi:MAG: hypothetical protein GY949_09215 [Gammaproteobacteria bacterium]|nr:hypothetical protein [Gammaproteobacteria bacterium]